MKNIIFITLLFLNLNTFCQNQDDKKQSRWKIEVMAGANNTKLDYQNKLTHPSNLYTSPQFKSVFSHFANITLAYKINQWLGVSVGASSLSYGFNWDSYSLGTSATEIYHIK